MLTGLCYILETLEGHFLAFSSFEASRIPWLSAPSSISPIFKTRSIASSDLSFWPCFHPHSSFSASFFCLSAPSTVLQAPVTCPENQWLPKVSLAPTVCQELKARVFPWITSLVLQPYKVDFIYPRWHRKELRLRKFKSLSQGHRASGRAWPRDVLGWLGTGTTRILRLGSQHLWSRTQSHNQCDYFPPHICFSSILGETLNYF